MAYYLSGVILPAGMPLSSRPPSGATRSTDYSPKRWHPSSVPPHGRKRRGFEQKDAKETKTERDWVLWQIICLEGSASFFVWVFYHLITD